MIDNESFTLFDELVKNDKYGYMFDLSIIYQVNETIESANLFITDEDFKKICNEVKRQYLKYEDVELNDELVESVINELKDRRGIENGKDN